MLLLNLLVGCSATLQSTRLLDTPPAGLPPQAELTDTPFFAQERYQCGPAALATLLAQRGVHVDPDALIDKVYLPGREGSVTIEMEATARRYGMLVYPLKPQLDALLREIAAGHPVLVLQNLGLDWWPKWHYAVVVGYDLKSGTIVLRSGTIARYMVSMDVFENTWQRGSHWARGIVPPDVIPASAEPLEHVQAGLVLEQSGQTQSALTAYRASTARWPDAAFAWLARGNLAYRLGLFDEAESSFRAGLGATPRDAALWNNLGYALAKRQCGLKALEAVRCALALDGQNPDYQDSLHELAAFPAHGGRCAPVDCPVPTGPSKPR